MGHFFPFFVRQLFSVNLRVEVNAVKQILATFFLFLCNSHSCVANFGHFSPGFVWLLLIQMLFIDMQICCFALLRARSSKYWIIEKSFWTPCYLIKLSLFWQSISIYRQTPEQNFANLPDPFGSYRNQLSMEDFVITQHDDRGEIQSIFWLFVSCLFSLFLTWESQSGVEVSF